MKQISKRKKKYSLYSYWMVVPILVLYVFFFIAPTIMGFGYSLTDWRSDRDTLSFVGLRNFIRVFTDEKILLAVKNTVVFTVTTVIGKNILGLLLATALNASLKTKNVLRSIFYIPSILSTVAIGVVFTNILHPEGILNQALAGIGLTFLQQDWLTNVDLVMFSISGVTIWMMVGYHMTIYLAGYQSISREYYEAAAIDGASPIQQFFRISLPMLRSSINMNLMLSIIAGLKVFTEVFVMTGGGPGNASQVLSTLVYESVGNGSWALGTTMNTVLFIVTSVVTVPLLMRMRRDEVEV